MTVPVGLYPPLTVALSAMEVPTGPLVGSAAVVIVGVAWLMVTGSSVQPELTETLLASPL